MLGNGPKRVGPPAKGPPEELRRHPQGTRGREEPDRPGSVHRAEFALQGFDVRANFGIRISQNLDFSDRAHDRRVVPISEGPPQLWKLHLSRWRQRYMAM